MAVGNYMCECAACYDIRCVNVCGCVRVCVHACVCACAYVMCACVTDITCRS